MRVEIQLGNNKLVVQGKQSEVDFFLRFYEVDTPALKVIWPKQRSPVTAKPKKGGRR